MSFWDRMDGAINKGVSSSKEILGRTKDKAKNLGEKGLLKWEIMQLEKQAEKSFAKLGVQVYNVMIINGQEQVVKADLESTLADLSDFKGRIEKKEKELRKIE